jgi:hypothetical protein
MISPTIQENDMKKPASLAAIAFLTFLPVAVQAQNADSASYHNSDASEISKKPLVFRASLAATASPSRLPGTVRIWKVINPEIFSSIDARHVRVRAHVDAAQGLIRIVSVGAIVDERTGIKLDDAAFRR